MTGDNNHIVAHNAIWSGLLEACFYGRWADMAGITDEWRFTMNKICVLLLILYLIPAKLNIWSFSADADL